MARGGKRSYPKDRVDTNHLADQLRMYCRDQGDAALDLGEYKKLWHSCQPRAKGLAEISKLIRVLLTVSPSLTIVYTDLKACLQDVLELFPNMITHRMTHETLASQLVVVQKHMRLLASSSYNERPWQKASKDLSIYQLRELKEIKEALCQQDEIQPPPVTPVKRKLVVQLSEVSVDADGLPTFSEFDAAWSKSKPSLPLVESEADGSEPERLPTKATGKQGLPAMVAEKRGTVLKKPAAANMQMECAVKKELEKGAQLAQQRAQKVDPANVFIDIETVALKGPYPKTKKSEILHWPAGKQQLVASLGAKKDKQFHEKLRKTFLFIKKQKHGVTKLVALEHLKKML